MAIFIIYEYPIIGGLLGFFYCLLDGLDGPLARYQNTANKAGSLLDILNDQLGIIFIPIFSIYYFHTNAIFAYLFGFFYMIDIILIVILNSLNVRTNFIIRVKYFYYFIFLVSCYLKVDFVLYFHLIFGIFYMLHSIYLFWMLMEYYSKKGVANEKIVN
jgi:phosphatidylglycerophosphate synthase